MHDSVRVVLYDVHVEDQQAHPVEPRLELVLCWSDATRVGRENEKFVSSAILAKCLSLAKMGT